MLSTVSVLRRLFRNALLVTNPANVMRCQKINSLIEKCRGNLTDLCPFEDKAGVEV